ncbi:MAG: glutamine--fructose-6-phosphate transaminase (isomerizing) [Polyangiaceae bacterium]|nr:glutamine--fructose-6-phosphate transaminase (isomerizing) [Polyangiaceae bacterium]
MCGIVGYTGAENAVPVLLECLRRLEYRGYDSAGMAVVAQGKTLVRRSVGKLAALETMLEREPLAGATGIGHTRWATHGAPSLRNAHPQQVDDVALVHNGIVENFLELRHELGAAGCIFRSDTDTEVIAQLVAQATAQGATLREAVRAALRRVRGSYALAVLCAREPNRIIAAANGLPLVLGLGRGEVLLGSDVTALLGRTERAVFLEDGEVAELSSGGARIWGADGQVVERGPRHVAWSVEQAARGGYKHFMLKEIHEQPRVLGDALGAYLVGDRVALGPEPVDAERARRLNRVVIAACGTSWHAALSGRIAIESLARLPCEAAWAHELRYADSVVDAATLAVAVSQSGETADTLAAARELRRRGTPLWAVCNVVNSSLTRAADRTLCMHAGPEISVASTKTYLASMAVLHLVALELGYARGVVSPERLRAAVRALRDIPRALEEALRGEEAIARVARRHAASEHFLFLGRGSNVGTALEGALKLKELAYTHAEGYPAGEMKHGPIALIDDQMPVVVVAPRDNLREKLRSNLIEARARGGRIIGLCELEDRDTVELCDDVLPLPSVDPLISPFAAAVPLQLFAYYVAEARGLDVDRPRNLAKSVTVE